MKRFRTILLLVMSFLLLFSCVACDPFESEWFARTIPFHYRGSVWETEDGKVRFIVNLAPSRYHVGSLSRDEGRVEMVFFGEDSQWDLEGCTAEIFQTLEKDLHGIIYPSDAEEYEYYVFREERYAEEGYFVAQVEASSIYEVGTEITFHRVDETKEIEVQDFILQDYETQLTEYPSKEVLAESNDLESAVQQAKGILREKYGISDEVEVYYDYVECCWLIKGTHWLEPFVSVPHILFRTDGTVLAIWEE